MKLRIYNTLIHIMNMYTFISSVGFNILKFIVLYLNKKVEQDKQREQKQFEATHTFHPLPMSKGGYWFKN